VRPSYSKPRTFTFLRHSLAVIAAIGNESVPKIIMNDTIFFLKLQSAFW